MTHVKTVRTSSSPRNLPYRPWYLTVLLLTAALTIPRIASLIQAMQATGKSLLQANSLADVCAVFVAAALLAGLLLTLILPGKRLGYRLCAYVMRVYNALAAVLLGVAGLAFVALVVITCMQIIPIPVALIAAALMLIAALCMLLCALFVHHAACCLNEAGGSARDGAWQSIRGHEAPLTALSLGMAGICAVVLIVEALCAAEDTHAMMIGLVGGALDALYAYGPSVARTLVRTIRETVEPCLDVQPGTVILRTVELLRYVAVALLYRDYVRMHRKAE